MLVKDIRAGSGSSSPFRLTSFGGTLIFSAFNDDTGFELWKSDGSDGGTVILKDIVPGPGRSDPRDLTVVDNNLFFTAFDASNTFALWKTDGTEAGTVVVKTMPPLSCRGCAFSNDLVDVNGTLFFRALDSLNGRELWKSDGSAAGTILVKDIRAGTDSSDPRELTNVNGVLFFLAWDGTSARLWKSDGSTGGTVPMKDFQGIGSQTPQELTNVNGTLFFRAFDSTSGLELWKSDGTTTGTVIVRDIFPGQTSSSPNQLSEVNGVLFFQAFDDLAGAEVWKSDGTQGGTVLVKDIRTDTDNSNPTELTRVGETVFFTAFDSDHGIELWKTDGTAGSTMLVKDVQPGPESSSPRGLTNVNGTLFFVTLRTIDGTFSVELWKSNGSTAGTILVKSFGTGGLKSTAQELTDVSGTLFFKAFDTNSGFELWKSDGSTTGTVLVKDIRPGPNSSSPFDLVDVGGTLFFSAFDDDHGSELWRSDGTEAGTELVRDIESDEFGSSPNNLTAVNGLLFFQPIRVAGGQLWKSDGSDLGTVLVKEIGLGARLEDLTNVNGTLFFTTRGKSTGALWKSDGTGPGTVLVKDLGVGRIKRPRGRLTAVINDTLFFPSFDSATGIELWKSDGTTEGTIVVKDIEEGPLSSIPSSLINANGTLFFTAVDETNGAELWMSDGTETGTVLADDIFPGVGNSNPSELTTVASSLLFAANDHLTGRELWSFPLDDTATPPGEDIIVEPVDPNTGTSPVSLGFEEVTEGGETTVETQTNGPPPPEGFKIGNNLYINIETTATFNGLVQVCFDYSPFNVNENKLQLRHFVPLGEPLTAVGHCETSHPDFSNSAQGCWEEITQVSPIPSGVGYQNEGRSNPDVDNDIICGLTASLSPFILVEALEVVGPTDPVQAGTEIEVSVDLTGSEPVDSAVWSWDDGAPDTEVPNPAGLVTVPHTYTEPGVYVVGLTLKKDGVNVGSAAFRYVVVFDPEGGFVTGGGSILSPPGAYASNELLTGIATFGFVSKYKKGADTVPTGTDTSSSSRSPDFNFHSASYEWLVVAGNKAQYKGEGTVNGQFGSDGVSGYGFLLTATDGDANNGGDGIDKFRIKVWDKSAGGGCHLRQQARRVGRHRQRRSTSNPQRQHRSTQQRQVAQAHHKKTLSRGPEITSGSAGQESLCLSPNEQGGTTCRAQAPNSTQEL